MPALSAEDRARRADDLAPMITRTPIRAVVRRPPAGAAKRGGVAEIARDVPLTVWPADGQTMPNELALIPAVAGQRVSAIGYALTTAAIQIGDEIETAAARYKVIGVARWQACIGLALNEVRAQP